MGSRMFTESDAGSYLRSALHTATPTIWVFDFDDTLVFTDCKVKVIDRDGTITSLTPAQFATYVPSEETSFDFSEFLQLINPRPNTWMLEIMKKIHDHHGHDRVAILSARSSDEPIREFLQKHEMPSVVAHACKSADPRLKEKWVENVIATGFRVEFFDDSPKNVAAVGQINGAFAHHVVHITGP